MRPSESTATAFSAVPPGNCPWPARLHEFPPSLDLSSAGVRLPLVAKIVRGRFGGITIDEIEFIPMRAVSGITTGRRSVSGSHTGLDVEGKSLAQRIIPPYGLPMNMAGCPLPS